MPDAFKVVALSPIRKAIAARMSEASQTIPHFRLTVDVEVDELFDLRKMLRDRRATISPTINDLFIKASAGALMEVPAVNIQWAEREIHQFSTANIAVVTALDGGGLSTPIVRGADRKSIWDIARETRELTARAAKLSLNMGEILGGSFSISNLGMYGVDQFDAIINSPQCAILAIGAARPRTVVSAEGVVRLATLVRMTLSCDHRAIDGTIGATFLSALRSRIEQPESLYSESETP